eukprot:1678-Prymnesium_polylepis.1
MCAIIGATSTRVARIVARTANSAARSTVAARVPGGATSTSVPSVMRTAIARAVKSVAENTHCEPWYAWLFEDVQSLAHDGRSSRVLPVHLH